MNAELDTVLIHIDPYQAADSPLDGAPTSTEEPLTGLRWYCEWLTEHSARINVLLPDQLRRNGFPLGDLGESASVVWYSEDGSWKLPNGPTPDRVWFINGERLPIVDWSSAGDTACRGGEDILVFDPSARGGDGHYSESVLVDTSGAVVQMKRHYDDSPAFTDLWTGQASVLITTGRLALPVVSHVLLRGWGLDSIGALTRRFAIRWSEVPCALSGAASRHVVTGPVRTTRNGPVRDKPGRPANKTKRISGATAVQVDPSAPSVAAPVSSRSTRGSPDVEVGGYEEDEDFPMNKPGDAWYFAVKRTLDLLICGTGLVVLSPLLMVIAVLIKLTSHGPVFFAHSRQGLGGKVFACLKFRSMSADADALQAKLRAKNQVDGPQFKMADDPRVTRLGNWLRRLNLDELPQLINVVAGQMSLVGPRPSPDAENRMCPAWRRTRLSVKPGITGLWQVLRRRNCPDSDFQEWIYYDVEYARHRSLWLDVSILAYTPASMFAPKFLDGFIRKLERRGICLSSDRRLLLEGAQRTDKQSRTGGDVAAAPQGVGSRRSSNSAPED